MPTGPIEVEGLKELNRAVSRAVDRELPKRMGLANKRVGQLVISKLEPRPDPRAVGAGAGSTVRPSATRREVVLRVGGAHRAKGRYTKMQPWGKRRVAKPGTRTPARPFIQGTAIRNMAEIEQTWLEAVMDALGPAFFERNP